MRSPRPGSRVRARTRGSRTSARWRARTRRSSACPGTAARRSARARASGPEAVRSASGMIRTYNAGPARAGVRRAVDDRLRRRPHGAGLHRGHARPGSRSSCGRSPRPASSRSGWAATTRSRSPSCARSPSVHGPLGLLHFDSHTDLWDSYNGRPYSHGTMFRRAIEEGILDPARTLQVGMRGPLYGADDEAIPGDLGVETIPWHELAELDAGGARRARARAARRRARVPHARRRLRRPRLLPRHRDAGGRRADSFEALSSCAPARTCRSSASTSWRSPRPTTARARSPPCSRPTRSSRCCRS